MLVPQVIRVVLEERDPTDLALDRDELELGVDPGGALISSEIFGVRFQGDTNFDVWIDDLKFAE
jgi:hypothetical protein